MPIAIVLVLAGALGPIAAVQWRRSRWLPAGRWLVRHLSVHAAVAAPVAGVFVSALGLSIVWPPGIVLAFLAAWGFVGVLVGSARRGRQHAVVVPASSAPPTRPPLPRGVASSARPGIRPRRRTRPLRSPPPAWPDRSDESRAG